MILINYHQSHRVITRKVNVRLQRLDDNTSTWKNAWHKIKTLSPFLWPKTDVLLQFRVIFCFFLLALGRVINLYVPIYNKKIVDSVTDIPIRFRSAFIQNFSVFTIECSVFRYSKPLSNFLPIFRWDLVLIYVGFKFLQGGGTGGMGLLNNLRSFLWIRIQQYTTREVEVELFK